MVVGVGVRRLGAVLVAQACHAHVGALRGGVGGAGGAVRVTRGDEVVGGPGGGGCGHG